MVIPSLRVVKPTKTLHVGVSWVPATAAEQKVEQKVRTSSGTRGKASTDQKRRDVIREAAQRQTKPANAQGTQAPTSASRSQAHGRGQVAGKPAAGSSGTKAASKTSLSVGNVNDEEGAATAGPISSRGKRAGASKSSGGASSTSTVAFPSKEPAANKQDASPGPFRSSSASFRRSTAGNKPTGGESARPSVIGRKRATSAQKAAPLDPDGSVLVRVKLNIEEQVSRPGVEPKVRLPRASCGSPRDVRSIPVVVCTHSRGSRACGRLGRERSLSAPWCHVSCSLTT